MQKISGAQLVEAMKWRNATKKFDNTKKIDEKTWQALEQALILNPSSYGAMPYKFIVVQNPELLLKLRDASYGQSQVADCSHHVVFVAKEKMDVEHLNKYVETMASIRGQNPSDFEGYKKMMVTNLVDRMSAEESFKWATNQAYIALGTFMTAAAVMGVDTCPFEGINPSKYDEILGLSGSGWRTVCACPAGFRALDDKYADLKKVRFDSSDLIIRK